MEPWIIVLGVIIIVIIFFIIRHSFSKNTAVDKVHLLEPPADISLNESANPKSILYSFGSWVYVNNFSNSVLYSYINDTDNPPLQFALILGGFSKSNSRVGALKGLGVSNSPVLTAIINGSTGGTGKSSFNMVTITNNFPVQKWVHVVVAVDTMYADCYIDGKLLISTPLNPQITSSPTNVPSIRFTQPGNIPKPDIWLTKVTRWDKPLDPQSVWNEYYSGNGLGQSGNLSVVLDVTSDTKSNSYTIYSNSE